jgi:protein phosphatase 2C
VSALCRNQMHSILAEDLASEASRFLERRRQQAAVWARGERAEEEAAWCAALRRAFARVDALSPLACACGAATVPRCACPLSGTTSAIVGSTAVVALVVGARVVVANCGDSRAVLCRGPHGAPPVPLSVDHKVRPSFLALVERRLGMLRTCRLTRAIQAVTTVFLFLVPRVLISLLTRS